MRHDPISTFQLAQQRHAADVRRAELRRLARSVDVTRPQSVDRRWCSETWRPLAELAFAEGSVDDARRTVELGLSQPCPLKLEISLRDHRRR